MTVRHLLAALVLVTLTGCVETSMSQNPGMIEEGRAFARDRCAHCHGIGRVDDSPSEQAPPFRRLHERYPVAQLAEAFAEGIVVGHADMPPFELTPREISALIAYLGSLEDAEGPGRPRY